MCVSCGLMSVKKFPSLIFIKVVLTFFLVPSVFLLPAMSVEAEEACDNELRMAVATVRRAEDYLSLIEPFVEELAESIERESDTLFAYGWSDAVTRFSNGEANLIIVPQSKLAQVYSQAKQLPLVKTPNAKIVIYTNKTSTIEGIGDLRNKRIAVINGSTGHMVAVKTLKAAGLMSEVELMRVTTPNQLAIGLLKGTYNAAIVVDIALGQLTQPYMEKLKIVEQIDQTHGLFLFVANCFNQDERDRLTATLLAYQSNPKIKEFMTQFDLVGWEPVSEELVVEVINALNDEAGVDLKR